MEACCSRFTAAEGGARLAAAARAQNTIVADHTAFIAMRLLHEEAYRIRGPLSSGSRRSVYVTRGSRVPCVAYDIGILTDLTVTSHTGLVTCADVDLEDKQVLVCTSEVARRLLEQGGLAMQMINVLIIDSCHLICKDEHLTFIMKLYKEADEANRPRVLALTYPLFASPKKHKPPPADQIDNSNQDTTTQVRDNENANVDVSADAKEGNGQNISDVAAGNDTLGVHENTDDFGMYQKFEWKIEELERALCCSADLAEDIDGVKRFSSSVTKPKELVVEYAACAAGEATGNYAQLEDYMRGAAQQAIAFLDEHRYDPTEIYGEDLYEELRSIPDPGIEPRAMFTQFLYILDQLGPYGADKAAFSLLMKLEKLKIKVPYERHFLLLCLCTSVFVKIRCFADDIFSQYKSEWEKIKLFSTPKVMRLAEILEKFKPNEASRENNVKDDGKGTEAKNMENLMKEIEGCDFLTLSNKIEDSVNSLEGNLKELNIGDTSDTQKSNDSEVVSKNCDNELQIGSDGSKDDRDAEIAINQSDVVEATSDSDSDTDLHKSDSGIHQDTTEINAAHKSDGETLKSYIEPSEPTQKREINKNEYSHQQSSNDDCRDILTEPTNQQFPADQQFPTEQQFTTEQQFPTEQQYPTGQQFPTRPLPGRRAGRAARGRGRGRGVSARAQQLLLNPDALCGTVYMKEPLMATILFMLCVEMSRHNPQLSFLCSQYSAIEKPADPLTEPREFEKQRRKQEDVLKKFRMHECNLLLATSSLEEGIDLPRCNLVLRWDVPASYRSFGLCRGRARAPRSACVLLSQSEGEITDKLIHNLATYKELDQIISRKCGCGVQDEPPQSEEEHADKFTSLILPYSPQAEPARTPTILPETPTFRLIANEDLADPSDNEGDILSGSPNHEREGIKDVQNFSPIEHSRIKDGVLTSAPKNCQDTKHSIINVKDKTELEINGKVLLCNKCIGNCEDVSVKCVCGEEIGKESQRKEVKVEIAASVDLSTAIALINRYCGKLPSDTFTRLAPQWWMETVQLPSKTAPGTEIKAAFICTLRLPLNCPVKYNIVGHPMPTRVLARRMVALQACRILHKSGELDNQLMPIGKDNLKMAELEGSGVPAGSDVMDLARPGTTKRRQYYYKRTARAFTDCQPVEDCTDSDLESGTTTVAPPGGEAVYDTDKETKSAKEQSIDSPEAPPVGPAPSVASKPDGRRNTLYCIRSTLHCALPERYNTRGRRLHAPQAAKQALAILMYHDAQQLQIPSFPVYTRSGEVRVSVECVPDADVRMTPQRGKLVRRFMRFVFAEVLRVRRRGMQLRGGAARNNYYIVPTVKTTNEDGSTKINVDWAFLEQIYQHTEEKKHSELEKPLFWHLDDEEVADDEEKAKNNSDNDKNVSDDENNGGNEKTDSRYKVDRDVGEEGSRNEINNCDLTEKDSNNDKDNTATSSADKKEESSETHSDDSNSPENIDKCKDNLTKNDDATTCIDQDANKKGCDAGKNGNEKGKQVKKMANPLLKPGETFVFDPEKYREAVVTPWYRNQDQPQFFLVAEICWKLTPDSAFPSATHTTFRDYYRSKYAVTLTQSDQPLLDVDHTSARLNLLTPRYVNRKGVALPVSSERTRRAKRDRLDQKQILVPELCRVHPFAAPLWFATVALPCVLYRINALLIADEIRRAVALEVALGLPTIDARSCPGFQWPPLDFGWSLAEVLSADEKNEKKKSEEEQKLEDVDNESRVYEDMETSKSEKDTDGFDDVEEKREKTINDILQEKEDAESGFEIGTWSNDMASSLPDTDYQQSEPLPSNLTLCTSVSGGANWSEPVQKRRSEFNPSRTFSVADSDCSYMTSDFDTDDSDLNSDGSDEDTDTSGFFSSKNSNAAMGVRIEYKTAHEAEAVDLERNTKTTLAPQADEDDDADDKCEQDGYMRSGDAPPEYIQKFHNSIEIHKSDIIEKGLLIRHNQPILDVLPEPVKEANAPTEKPQNKEKCVNDITSIKAEDLKDLFPYGNEEVLTKGGLNLENIEKHKRILLAELKDSMPEEEIKKLNCFSMVDVDIDSPSYTSNRITNVGFDCEWKAASGSGDYEPYYQDGRSENGKKEFDFDYQPNLEGHPGPSPSVILQALTMSNANDGINLERLETIGDSFLKFAITAYLYCAHPTVHEGKLSHMRSKQVSNLNLYRLGRDKRLGARMIASKFEPHDNWLPPCHAPPAHHQTEHPPSELADADQSKHGEGCFIPYNLITQHSIPDKSIADCVEALIGAYLLWCGPRGALLFMSWLGLRVLPHYTKPANPPSSESSARKAGTLPPYQDEKGRWWQTAYGELRAPPSPLLRYISDPDGELERMLSGYSALEDTLHYRFRDRSLLLQALTHASHVSNRLTDCYQRLEFLGDAILDYLITRHLYEDPRRHSPGALTDLRSALVNNTIFATLCVRHGLHKYFRHMSPGLNEVLTNYVRIQEENGHSISEEHYLIQEDTMEQAEDVEVPKALGDLFESVAGAIFLDSGMSLGAVWASYVRLMGAELEAFSAAAPKSPVRELLEAEPDTAKFGKPERLADGRRVRVSVEVFGRGCFKGVGRNYRIAKGTAARCALRHLRRHR